MLVHYAICVAHGVCIVMGSSSMFLFLFLVPFLVYDDRRNDFIIILSQHPGACDWNHGKLQHRHLEGPQPYASLPVGHPLVHHEGLRHPDGPNKGTRVATQHSMLVSWTHECSGLCM